MKMCGLICFLFIVYVRKNLHNPTLKSVKPFPSLPPIWTLESIDRLLDLNEFEIKSVVDMA